MKDLKHYFTSPAGSDNEVLNGNNEIISRKRKIKSESNSLECTSTTLVGTKKKKKKKNYTEESEQDKSPEIDPPKSQKKRKRTIEKASLKKTRITKLLENVNIPQKTEVIFGNEKLVRNQLKKSVDSSKENSMNSSLECDEKSFDISNNLHNYFGKIDKPPDIHLKSNILKVEAIVHFPPSEEKTKPPKRLKTRLRRRKSLDLRPEYDIITSEEDNSSLQNSLNELSADVTITLEHESTAEEIVTSSESLTETSEITDKIVAKFQSNPGKYSTPVPVRVKHDGTLNSFFKIHNKMIEHSLQEVSEDRKLAKQQFLNSGIPDNIRKVMNKQKDVVLIEGAPFPKQQHVTQADTLSVMWNLKIIKLKLKIPQPHLISIPPWSHIIMLKSETESLGIEGAELNSLDRKKIIKALSKEIPDYPIKKWYAELFKMKAGCENEMWTEKYKPKSSLHLIGNSKNVEKLKSWLQNLNTKIKKENVIYCSDDEFLKSEDESVTDIKNTALLQGPAGIGKTASVYALAEEIGYQILEINTSCNRMGKKILHEFSEALQSHKVEANVLNFIGRKKNKVDDSKKSLILIEDIDVTFPDYDEGFLSTVATLAATSKRPIIFTMNNFNPKYLAKIIPFIQFKLDFEPLHQNGLCSWVRTLAAVEGIDLDKPKADKLIEWANGDIRKLLLQLQFSLTNYLKVNYSEHQIQTNNIWERMSQNRFDTREQAKNTAHLYNLLVVCDLLNGVLNCQLSSDDPAKKPWHSTLKYSSELSQPNESTDHPTRHMLADAVQILKEKAPFRHQYQSLRYDKSFVIPSIEREVLSFSSVLSHSSVAIDYLPVLRTIARYENKRLAEHTKRNNRYFSYLQSIGITENTIKISNVLSETLSTVV